MPFANYRSLFFFHLFLRLLIHQANNSMSLSQKVEVLVCWTVTVSNPIIFFPSWLGGKGHRSLFALPTLYLLYWSQGISTRHSRHQSSSVWWRPCPLSWWQGHSHSSRGALPLRRPKTWWPPRARDRTRFKPGSIDVGRHSLSEATEHPRGESKSCPAGWAQNLTETTPWSVWVFNPDTTEATLN